MTKKAFTLIEMVTVIILLSIMVGTTLPSLRDFHAHETENMVKLKLFHTLQNIRLIAIKRQEAVAVCGSIDGYHCDKSWESGYIVFLSPLDCQLQDKRQILLFINPVKGQGPLRFHGFREDECLRFLSNGMTDSNNGTFFLFSRNGHLSKKFFVDRSGRIRE